MILIIFFYRIVSTTGFIPTSYVQFPSEGKRHWLASLIIQISNFLPFLCSWVIEFALCSYYWFLIISFQILSTKCKNFPLYFLAKKNQLRHDKSLRNCIYEFQDYLPLRQPDSAYHK